MVTCSTGSLHVLWSRNRKNPYFYPTCSIRYTCRHRNGSCGCRTGLGTPARSSLLGTVRARADAVRAWKYPYDQSCVAVWGPVRPVSARTDYIYQTKADYMPFDPCGNRMGHTLDAQVFFGHKIVGIPLLKVVHAQLSATGYTAPVRVKPSSKCRVITQGFSRFGPDGDRNCV